MRSMLFATIAAWSSLWLVPAQAAEATLKLSFGQTARSFKQSDLLSSPDAADLKVAKDVAYGSSMIFRAVPLLKLLGLGMTADFDTLEASATDGFVSQLPVALIEAGRSGGSIPWLAIEDPQRPWPNLPGKSRSAGPFYLVWESPERSAVGPEQWPYALSALTAVQSPARRWPQMAVAETLGGTAPERNGMNVFVKNCLPCHKLKGGGEGTIGPDLAEPMSPTDYFTPQALRVLIRNPSAVRSWPDQKMGGFDQSILSNAELDDLIAYLAYVGRKR